jgi:hypothetical protein
MRKLPYVAAEASAVAAASAEGGGGDGGGHSSPAHLVIPSGEGVRELGGAIYGRCHIWELPYMGAAI